MSHAPAHAECSSGRARRKVRQAVEVGVLLGLSPELLGALYTTQQRRVGQGGHLAPADLQHLAVDLVHRREALGQRMQKQASRQSLALQQLNVELFVRETCGGEQVSWGWGGARASVAVAQRQGDETLQWAHP